MVVQTPPAWPSTPDSLPEAGVIEDARARQRRHRRTGVVLVAAAVAAGVLIAVMAGGGGGAGTGRHAGGQPSGSGPGATHASASRAFSGAPSTQPNGYGVETDACPLAAPNGYLPARSGCVTVMRADVNGDGRPDLILGYSRLSRQHPSGYPGIPPSLRREFGADAAFLKIVLANGTSVSTRLTQTRAAAIASVAHVNDDPGSEILLEISRISSGANGVAYGYHDGRLVPAGVTLNYGGDSAARAGFNCLPGNPPRVIQRTYENIGPTVNGWWQETNITYTWHGPRLVQTAKRTFKRRGAVTASESSIGHGCAAGVG
jgi:hypothetical protein